MPSFPKPSFTYNYNVNTEIAALRKWRDTEPGRAIPAKAANRVLIGTWNIANLGAQDRNPRDHALLAEVVSWFDVVALQEVKNDRPALMRCSRHCQPAGGPFTPTPPAMMSAWPSSMTRRKCGRVNWWGRSPFRLPT